MNVRMEKEIDRTIQLLQASMPKQKDAQASVSTLLMVAASEMNGFLLFGLFVGALVFGVASVKVLSMPMLSVFCTAPMPMLILFHRYVLSCNDRMRELEDTFQYSYAEMLIARSTVISFYMFGTLIFLSMALHFSVGENFLRLALCGAVPSIYLCTLLLFVSSIIRNQEGLSIIAIVFWAALCFLITVFPFNHLLQICSTLVYAALAIFGLILYGICYHNIRLGGTFYVGGLG